MNDVKYLLLGAAVAAGLAVVLVMNRGNSPAAILVIVGLGIAAGGVVLFLRSRRSRDSRSNAALAIEEDPNLSYTRKASDGWHRRHRPLGDIPKRGDVHHLITGQRLGLDVTVFQHSYIVHTGQATIPVARTVLMAATPSWPRVVVKPRHLGHWMLDLLGLRRGLELENELMHRRFRIVTDDPQFAELLLDTELQAYIASKPGVTWDLAAGRLALIYKGKLRFDRLDAGFERLAGFLDLVPEELALYGDGNE